MSQQMKRPDEVTLMPVGVIKNEIKEAIVKAGSDDIELGEKFAQARKKIYELREKESELIIEKELESILDGIEDFSHVMVLYWAHLIPPESRSLTKIHPMGRKEFPLTGVFATCSPARPNPVLATVVQLTERNGNILKVKGLDAVDGSPLLDIKPFAPGFYPREGVKTSEWMEQIQQEFS